MTRELQEKKGEAGEGRKSIEFRCPEKMAFSKVVRDEDICDPQDPWIKAVKSSVSRVTNYGRGEIHLAF